MSTHQSFRRAPLSLIFGAGSHVRVLRELFRQGGPLAPTQILPATKLSDKGMRLALAALVETGIIKGLGIRQSQLYEIDADHPLTPALRSLFAAEKAAWEETLEQLRNGLETSGAIRAAWLYGSVARGEDRPDSDTDLAILAESDDNGVADQARDDANAVSEKLGLGASVIVISPNELATDRVGQEWFDNVSREAAVLKGKDPSREKTRCKRALQKEEKNEPKRNP